MKSAYWGSVSTSTRRRVWPFASLRWYSSKAPDHKFELSELRISLKSTISPRCSKINVEFSIRLKTLLYIPCPSGVSKCTRKCAIQKGGTCAKRISHSPKASYTPAQAGYTTPEAKRPEGTPPKSLIILRFLLTLLSLFLFSCLRCGLLDLFLLVLSFSHDIVVLKFLSQMTTFYFKFPKIIGPSFSTRIA